MQPLEHAKIRLYIELLKKKHADITCSEQELLLALSREIVIHDLFDRAARLMENDHAANKPEPPVEPDNPNTYYDINCRSRCRCAGQCKSCSEPAWSHARWCISLLCAHPSHFNNQVSPKQSEE